MITKGSVDVYKKSMGAGKIASLGVNSFFGERALLSAQTRQATCVAASTTELLTLIRDDFVLMLGDLTSLLEGRKNMSTRKTFESAPSFAESVPSREKIVHRSRKEFRIKRLLGKGAFGRVSLAESRDGKLYALKSQAKASIVKHGHEEKAVSEYQLLRELGHPLIGKCFQAFQDKKYIYFLMELLPGKMMAPLRIVHSCLSAVAFFLSSDFPIGMRIIKFHSQQVEIFGPFLTNAKNYPNRGPAFTPDLLF